MSSRSTPSLLAALTLLLLALGFSFGGQQGVVPEQAASTPSVSATAEPVPVGPTEPFRAQVTPTDDPPTRSVSAEEVDSTRVRTGPEPTATSDSTATGAADAAPTSAPRTTPSASPGSPSGTSSTGASPGAAAPASVPGNRVAWVSLAAAGVDHPVVARGLSPEGTISPAQGEVLWFTGYGRVQPGHVGTAVVAAHVSYRGVPDVFAGLHRTRAGDVVRVGYQDGTVLELPVVDTQVVDKGRLQYSTTVWGENSSTRRVVLVTCDDTYGYRPDGHRAANFVVVAEL